MALFVSCKDVPISQQTKNACSDQLHSSTVNSYAPICRMQQCIALHICRVETIPASRSSANPHKQLAVDLFWECHMLSCRDLMSHCGKHCVIISEATLGFFIGSHFLRLRCPYRSTSTGAQVGSCGGSKGATTFWSRMHCHFCSCMCYFLRERRPRKTTIGFTYVGLHRKRNM